MAPELFRGEEASPASDVYALGISLFQMLTGRLPWRDVSLRDLARHGRTEQVPDIRDLQSGVSAEVAECVRTMTVTDLQQRPADAVAASRLLHAVSG